MNHKTSCAWGGCDAAPRGKFCPQHEREAAQNTAARVDAEHAQPSLFDAPIPRGHKPERARARSTHPETSHAAAAALSLDALSASQREVFAVLRAIGPSTDERLVQVYHAGDATHSWQSDSGIRTRRHELTERGLVRYTGRTAKVASGANARVYEVVPLGNVP